MAYADQTNVSVEKSRAELESIVLRYGAARFASMIDQESKEATIGFTINNRHLRFTLPLPDIQDKRFWFTPARRNRRSQQEAYAAWEQECRSKWRSLVLCVKAKLEAVAAKITTFEKEFLAHFVLPDGRTVGDVVIPRLIDTYTHGNSDLLLPAHKTTATTSSEF